jgi:diacylglycerol kinase family enzyme
MIFIAEAAEAQMAAFWQSDLKTRGLAHTWHSCAASHEAIRQARRAQGPVVAVGDDRWVNIILNGLMMSGGLGTLGVLPTNPASDFCRAHGLPTEKTEALETVLAARTRPMDAALARLSGGGPETVACYFTCGLNLSIQAPKTLWPRRPFTTYLTLDGKKFEFPQTEALTICKSSLLTLTIKLHSKKTTNFNFTHAEIVTAPKLPVNFAHSPSGFTPLTAELKQNILELFAPSLPLYPVL